MNFQSSTSLSLFFFSLSWEKLASTRRPCPSRLVDYILLITHQLISQNTKESHFASMPLSNGDLGTSTAQLIPGKSALDFDTALEVLLNEEKDGIDAETLLDSKLNGGLTYNDFLVLPGYIGSFSEGHPSFHIMLICSARLCCVRGRS